MDSLCATPKDEACPFFLTPELKATQEKMATMFERQKANGGIIDVEAEKNKYLVKDDVSWMNECFQFESVKYWNCLDNEYYTCLVIEKLTMSLIMIDGVDLKMFWCCCLYISYVMVYMGVLNKVSLFIPRHGVGEGIIGMHFVRP